MKLTDLSDAQLLDSLTTLCGQGRVVLSDERARDRRVGARLGGRFGTGVLEGRRIAGARIDRVR